jgi:acetyl-CoA carboxylase biotin carboxyl carrier protein
MSSKIDYDEIKKLIKFMEEKNLSHFELEMEGLKVKLSRGIPPLVSSQPTPSPQPSAEPEAKESTLPLESKATEVTNNLHYITSPMVGTFYRAPDPSSSPFVEVGDQVKKNQTLCIIEAMKLMNEIESDVDGILSKVYAENGKPVEFGQKLFAIKPVA